MKRFLLCMLTAGMICSSMVAQNDVLPSKGKAIAAEMSAINNAVNPEKNIFPIPFNNSRSVVEAALPENLITVESGYLSMGSFVPGFQNVYDRQSQGTPYEMMYVHDDGYLAAAWTASSDAADAVAGRGIVYSSYSPITKKWNIEYPVADQQYTYWPSYLPWGENGELIVVRINDKDGLGHSGLGIFRRENKGEGDWESFTIPNPLETGSMVWQRCCVTGENNEYLHVATGFSFELDENNNPIDKWNDRYTSPMVYNRSSDGGKTWDFEWTVLPDLVNEEWKEDFNYTEDIAWATPHGSDIAFIGATLSQDCIIMKSNNHGEPGSWEKIMVYECATDMTPGEGQKVDSGYRALLADVTFDNAGKLHAAMSVIWARPDTVTENRFYYSNRVDFCGLLYWNEERGTYTLEDVETKFEEWRSNCFYMYEDETGEGKIVLSEISKKNTDYFIAGPVPIVDTEGIVEGDGVTYYEFKWIVTEALMPALSSYRQIGLYGWPQLFCDSNNGLHLIYAGPLDGEKDTEGHQRRHIFHTYSNDEFQTFNHHKDMSTFLAIRNNEFSYPRFGGWIHNEKFMFMAQVDPLVGTHLGSTGEGAYTHAASSNSMYAFTGTFGPGNMDPLNSSSTMLVYPNPATNSVTISFEGKCNIELYNMVGQKIYQAESVTTSHQISLENLASGVYFVTVRDGKQASTQKLIVQ